MINYTIRKTPKGYLVLCDGTPLHLFETRAQAKQYVEMRKGA